MALYLLLLVAAEACPLVEQPISSLLMLHDRMLWALRVLRGRGFPAPCSSVSLRCVRGLCDSLPGCCSCLG